MTNRFLSFLLVAFIVAGCTQSRVRRYGELLDNLVGSENKDKVASVLGPATKCEAAEGGQRCEYRTAAGRNLSSPGIHQPAPGFGPDVSPYDTFDVINVYYNNVGIMREWEPVVLPPSP